MAKFVINKSDIVHNYNCIAHKTDALVIPTLKADCYGLGALEVMKLLHAECGVNTVAVSRLEEALELCSQGCDILLLSCYHDSAVLSTLIEKDIIFAVDSIGQARRASALALEKNKVARVHIKIDTGFGRFGFMPGNLPEIKEVYRLEGLRVCGIFSHFSSAFASESVTDKQFDTFMGVLEKLKESGIEVGLRHIANSSATFRSDKYHLDAVRIGSALLGRLPMRADAPLKRVGRFEAEIADIRTLKKGSNIGYGNVFALKQDTRVAVLCTGSADGVLIKKDYDTFRVMDILRYGFGVFKMLFSDNRLKVTVNGKPTRTVGRVALTHTMVDVTGIDCACGDKAVIDISPLYVSSKVEREYI